MNAKQHRLGRVTMARMSRILVTATLIVLLGTTASMATSTDGTGPEPPPECAPHHKVESVQTRTPLEATPDGETPTIERRRKTVSTFVCSDGSRVREISHTPWRVVS